MRSASRRQRRARRRLAVAAGALLAAAGAWHWLAAPVRTPVGTAAGTVAGVPAGMAAGAADRAGALARLGDLDVPAAQAEAARRALGGRPVVLTWEGREWTFTLDGLGVTVGAGGAVTVDLERLAGALAAAGEAVAAEAAPARLVLEGEVPRVEPDRPGRRLDPALGARLLREALEAPLARQAWDPAAGPPPPLRLPLPVQAVTATPTERQLLALGIRRRIAAYTTRYDPGIPRGENVERAARALDGLLLRPGELFSYNAAVGPITPENGWREAYVILGGELVPGVGGGVCQTATTLYGAALRAGLTVVERHPHALSVAYADPSQDAAVSPGLQDLKLRNTLPAGVLFRVQAGGGTVTVEVWGDAPPGREIRIESAVAGEIGVPVRVVPDPALAPGAEVVELAGRPGFRSRAWRLVLQDGQEVSRELLSTDVYAPTPRVVRRGPG